MFELITYYENEKDVNGPPAPLRGCRQYKTVAQAEERAQGILLNYNVLWLEIVKPGTRVIVKVLNKAKIN